MQLIYLRIREFRDIIKQEFNFSPIYDINLIENTLQISLKDDAVDIFKRSSGNVLNLTAIIGDNGSGKSSLMQFIWLIIEHNYALDYIAIFYDENKKKIIVYDNDSELSDILIFNNTSYEYDHNRKDVISMAAIRYNECFTIADYYNFITDDLRSYADYSMMNRLAKSMYDSRTNKELEYITDFLEMTFQDN